MAGEHDGLLCSIEGLTKGCLQGICVDQEWEAEVMVSKPWGSSKCCFEALEGSFGLFIPLDLLWLTLPGEI